MAPTPDRRRAVSLGVGLPAALYAAVTVGYDSSYSHQLYDRAAFVAQYRHGIYRYRVVGREAVLFADRGLHHFHLALHTPAVDLARGGATWELFTAFFVVNGLAFVAWAALLYGATVGAERSGQRAQWVAPYLVLVVLVAASAYVVTPYDTLSYLLVTAACVGAFRGWPWPALLVLAVVGTATRESFMVGVAAVVAGAAWWPAAAAPGRVRVRVRLRRAAAALAVGSVGTYVGLRALLHDPREPATFWWHVPRALNGNMGSVVAGLLLALSGWVLWAALPPLRRSAAGSPGAAAQAWYRRASLGLWVLSVPYLVLAAVGGIWFEALRLALPVLLCQYLLRWAADLVPGPVPAHRPWEASRGRAAEI